MSNLVVGIIALAWFGAGIGIIVVCGRWLKSLREWIEIQMNYVRAHRLNKRREELMAAIKRVGGCPDWETVCRIERE